MTFRGFHFATAVWLACATAADAGQWTWPDGKFALTLPDDGSIKRMKGSGPAVAVWTSADGQERIYMGVRRNADEAPLDPKELERELARPMTSRLISTVRHDVEGVPSYTTSLRGSVKGKTQSVIQRAITFEGRTYLIRAEGPAKHGSDARTTAAVRSLTLVRPATVAKVAAARFGPGAERTATRAMPAAARTSEATPVEVNAAPAAEPLTDRQLGAIVGKVIIVGGLVAMILTILTKKRPKPLEGTTP